MFDKAFKVYIFLSLIIAMIDAISWLIKYLWVLNKYGQRGLRTHILELQLKFGKIKKNIDEDGEYFVGTTDESKMLVDLVTHRQISLVLGYLFWNTVVCTFCLWPKYMYLMTTPCFRKG